MYFPCVIGLHPDNDNKESEKTENPTRRFRSTQRPPIRIRADDEQLVPALPLSLSSSLSAARALPSRVLATRIVRHLELMQRLTRSNTYNHPLKKQTVEGEVAAVAPEAGHTAWRATKASSVRVSTRAA